MVICIMGGLKGKTYVWGDEASAKANRKLTLGRVSFVKVIWIQAVIPAQPFYSFAPNGYGLSNMTPRLINPYKHYHP
jgi:hypothetical protein